MNKAFKWTLIVLIAVLLVIQVIPKGLPEITPGGGNDLMSVHAVPENVAGILKASCYDCHSNQTIYPWYSYVVPVNFLIVHDVNEGREELNFSEWGTYERKKQIKKLEEIVEEVEEGEMPLPIYTITHGNAKINEEQLAALKEWTESLSEEILSLNE